MPVCVEKLESRRLLASITANSPLNGAQQVSVGSNMTVTFGEAMNAATLTSDRIVLRDTVGTVVPAALSYNSTTRVLTIDPTNSLINYSGYYSVRIVGGASGVKASDGSALAADHLYAFTTSVPNFSMQTAFSGLINPSNIEFAADGRIFIAEKGGVIKQYDNFNDTTPTITADIRSQVHNFWDRGLLGMALDPQFTTGRPYIYVLYTYDGTQSRPAPVYGTVTSETDSGGSDPGGSAPASGRLSRLTIGADGKMSGSEQVLVWDWNIQYPSHSVGDIKFGPDGYLYASGGDGASFNGVDYGQFGNPFNDPANEGGALRALDALSDADPTGLAGTIIRIDPNTGAAAPGNPYSSSGDANKRRLIALGLRNPFRFTFRPDSSEIWAGDVGWNDWEEINRINTASDAVADNFGWPAWEGNAHQSGYDSANRPLIENFYNAGGDVKPYYAYSHAAQVVSGSGEPTGGSSLTGTAFYAGGNYPIAYTGAFFFADYSRLRTYVLYAGPNGLPDPATRQVFSAPGFGSVELQVGPNGDLFSVDLHNGRVMRYVATGYNRAPTARITSNVVQGALPLVVNFSGLTSTDPDAGDVLSYSWDLNGDGVFNDSTSATPTQTYSTAGVVNVQLRVTDVGGATSVVALQIRPGATPPVPIITAPAAGGLFSAGQVVTLAGSATDAEEGTLPGSKLRWDISLVHASEIDTSNYHLHEITSFTGTGGSFVAPDHEYPNWVEIKLTATDSTGLSTSVTRRLDPRTVVLSFNSNPPGLQFAFNSSAYTTPFTRTVVVNSTSSITAISPQTLGSNTYSFGSWSQGGGVSQSIIGPAASTSYTATYNVSSIVKLSGTVIGTSGATTAGATRDKAFDGSLGTFFDAPTASSAWAGLDLGSARAISRIRFAPRADYPSRMVGGKFQASNDANFASGVVDLYTVLNTPVVGQYADVAVGDGSSTNGLTAYYFNSMDFSGSPVVRVDPTINFTWGDGSPGTGINTNQFSTRWSGQLLSVEAGTYSFRVTGDDGVRLWVNDQLLVDQWKDQGPTNYTATLSIPAATRVNLRMEYYENGGGATAQLAWQRPGQTGYSAIPTANLYAASAVPAGATYRYVRYLSSPDGYANVSEVEFYTAQVLAAPSAPSGLVATSATGAINLAWADNSSNETAFILERRLASAGTWAEVATVGAGTVEYSDAGVTAGTAYDYRVKARNSVGDSAYSNLASATASGSVVVVPAAPTALSGVAVSATHVNVSWTDNATNETQYVIERALGVAGAFQQIGIAAANVTTFADTGASAATAYRYRVFASNSAGSSAHSNVASVSTPAASTTPAAPGTFAAQLLAGSQVKLTWADNSSNETGFKIERRYAGWIWEPLTTTAANAVTYTDTTTIGQVVYEYRILAAGSAGNSGWVDGLLVDTSGAPQAPAAPGGLVATPISGTRVDLVWDDNSTTETGFKIERRLAGGTFVQINTVAANVRGYSDTSVIAGNMYEYRVRATTGSLDSAYSAIASATTPGGATGVPAAPSGIALTLLAGPQVRVNWTDNSNNEIGFRIQRRYRGWIWEDLASVASNLTTYLDPTASGGDVVYEYRVLAIGGTGNSPYSAAAEITVP